MDGIGRKKIIYKSMSKSTEGTYSSFKSCTFNSKECKTEDLGTSKINLLTDSMPGKVNTSS